MRGEYLDKIWTNERAPPWCQTPWQNMARDTGYNILALHTVWSQVEVEAVLGPGAKFVTILRDPVDCFESLYNYVHFRKGFIQSYMYHTKHQYLPPP